MNSHHKYLAAFDLDRTILPVNSSKLILTAARKNGLMSRWQLSQAIGYFIIYKFDLLEPTRIVNAMMGWLKGMKEEDVIRINNELIIPTLIKTIRPEMKAEIEYHKNHNAKVIILSSALPYLCNPISNHLGMDDVICSHLEVVNGRFTGKSIGSLVYKHEKQVQMAAYCEKHKFSLNTAWYYGDAFTDRFVLSAVGNPVCVKPEIKLRLRAKKRGWKVMVLKT